MLNINQNFDLKAPVFNFDRDYFNSVDELNAYDTSNVPDHFVTNVAGMLYQFTDGKWLPIIGTTSDDEENAYYINLGSSNCSIDVYPNSNYCQFSIGPSEDYSSISGGNVYMYADAEGDTPNISMRNSTNGAIKNANIGQAGGVFGLDIINEKNGNISNIKMLVDKELTQEEQDDGYSPVDISLTDGNQSANINAGYGFTHKTDDGYTVNLDAHGIGFNNSDTYTHYSVGSIGIHRNAIDIFRLDANGEKTSLTFGNDEKFKISRPIDDTEGATITGIKSLTAFSNPSATKVWATDGSTVDLSTKANTSDLDAKANASDVLLKKSESGGYYIEENSNKLGSKAFATNSTCSASGVESHAEGHSTRTTGGYSHAEGWQTLASGICSHTEGEYNEANGYCSHAQGSYNVSAKDVIHSVGIGTIAVRKNAEYIYAKNNTNGSALADDPKNGYKYLIGVGGYDGISTDNTTYKSVQEVIADLTARIEQLETKVKALEDANTPA